VVASQARRIGDALRARRIELGLTQEDLATQLGINRTTLSALETGRTGQTRLLFDVATSLGLELIALPRESRQTRILLNESSNRASGARQRVRHNPGKPGS